MAKRINTFKDTFFMGDKSWKSNPKSTPRFKGILYENVTDEFGRSMLKPVSTNTVVLGGAITALESLTGVTATFQPKTLNEILQINESNLHQEPTIGIPTIALFGIGNEGATLDFGTIAAKDIKSDNIPGMIPIRVCEELTGPDGEKYYMKKRKDGDATKYEYYLKEFSDVITVKSLWKDSAESDDDGTEINSDIAEFNRDDGIESFAEMKIDLNVHDGREYYEDQSTVDMARYNTLGIYTGNKVTLPDGGTDYINVRLLAYTNFNNRDLSLKTEASYTYRIYALV